MGPARLRLEEDSRSARGGSQVRSAASGQNTAHLSWLYNNPSQQHNIRDWKAERQCRSRPGNSASRRCRCRGRCKYMCKSRCRCRCGLQVGGVAGGGLEAGPPRPATGRESGRGGGAGGCCFGQKSIHTTVLSAARPKPPCHSPHLLRSQ